LQIFVLGIIVIVLFSSTAFAQELQVGVPAVQSVKITINEDGSAHVTHVVEPGSTPQQLGVIRSDFDNLQITNEDGADALYAEAAGKEPTFVIFPSNVRVFVEYDLANALTKKDNFWIWSYSYVASTSFFLPKTVDLIYTNENPIDIAGLDGIRCHGCQVKIEYELKKTELVKQVKWEDKKFNVQIITRANLKSFEFDQSNKMISFEVKEANKHITLIIPQELLWNPYEVFLNGEQIHKHERPYTDGQIILSITPNETGTVEIIGVSAVPEFPITAILVLGAAMALGTKLVTSRR
jgi:hypothetical protein